MLLSRDQILGARVPHRDLSIPEWGGTVRLQPFTIASRLELLDIVLENHSQYTAFIEDQARDEDQRLGLAEVVKFDDMLIQIIFCIVDEHGKRIFSTSDHEIFKQLSYPTIEALWREIAELNAMKPLDVAHEAEKKSSAPTTKSGSHTGSRSR